MTEIEAAKIQAGAMAVLKTLDNKDIKQGGQVLSMAVALFVATLTERLEDADAEEGVNAICGDALGMAVKLRQHFASKAVMN